MQGDLCAGGPLCRGTSVQGVSVMKTPLDRGNERAVHILLEYILVIILIT